jgi:sulfur-carrier protein
MKIKILIFGQLAEMIGEKELEMNGYADTRSLVTALHQQFPVLAQSKYMIAVNQQMITQNTNLSENTTVALMPPFSGG